MRKNILSLSIAAMIGGLGFAGAASASVLTTPSPAGVAQAAALNVTNSGTGHILVVPYYTAQNSNATLVNLVNTDATNGKEVKIRFRGASNSDDVFDFTLYMSPSDMWSFKVQADGNGLANLITYDRSCTTLQLSVPTATPGYNFGFPTGRLPAAYTTAQKNAETREGYIEILNTANIPPAAQPGQVTTGVTANALFTTIKHVAGVPACSSSILTALASTDFKLAISAAVAPALGTAAEGAASTSGLTSPTGGLFANSTILNLASTLTFTQPATAITAVTVAGGTIPGAGYIVHSPQQSIAIAAAGGTYTGADAGPPAIDPTANGSTADPLLRSTVALATGNTARVVAGAYTNFAVGAAAPITPLYQDLPDLSTPYAGAGGAITSASPLAQAVALTAALAAKNVMNEYQTVASIGGATDWTFSMPTRRYSVAMDYVARAASSTADGRVFTDLAGTAAGAATGLVLPSANRYFAIDNTSVSGNQICVSGDATNGVQTFDREEGTTSAGITISPGSSTVPSFCGEVSVVSFNVGNITGASVLGATLARQDFPMIGAEGWSRISTLGLAPAAGVVTLANSNGLPVIGASYMKATGATSNYGLIANHRYTR